jgi:hypothetical protein
MNNKNKNENFSEDRKKYCEDIINKENLPKEEIKSGIKFCVDNPVCFDKMLPCKNVKNKIRMVNCSYKKILEEEKCKPIRVNMCPGVKNEYGDVAFNNCVKNPRAFNKCVINDFNNPKCEAML